MQPNLTLLVKHQYDALNRLVASTPATQAASQRFYLKDRLSTEIQGSEQRSIMQHGDQLLAQQQRQNGTVETRLLATDPQRSVLNILDATQPHPLAYTPYGHRPLGNGLLSLLGFNGERPDPVTGWYLLGNGYRPFNPVLMCFTSPDSWSPFGEGGLNAYAYCVGDPVNRLDPMGHSFVSILKWIGKKISPKSKKTNLQDKPLIGVYKKRENLQGVSNAPTSISSQTNPQRPVIKAQPTNTHPRKMSPKEFLPIFLEQREKTIKTLLKHRENSNFPGEKEVFNEVITSFSEPLVEIKLHSIPVNLSNSNDVIRGNLSGK
ncbi:TPA: RHS repeat-associated core domain-containing protein [Pseudomonas putida]|nr:RHS repeat-associated core domain-containing protein [Pseudomonas putida]